MDINKELDKLRIQDDSINESINPKENESDDSIPEIESESEDEFEGFDNTDPSGKESFIDLRSLNYISTPDHLNCPICQLPFINPYTTVCGHTFCKTCIIETLKSAIGNKCPLDRTPLNYNEELDDDNNENGSGSSGGEEQGDNGETETPPRTTANDIFPSPIIISNITDDLKVSCLNNKRGCEWVGSRWQIKIHLVNECQCTRFQCENVTSTGELCPKLTRRRYLNDNGDGGSSSNKNCPHELFKCRKCDKMVNKINEEYHLNNKCLKNLVKCTGCSLNFPVKVFEKHESYCEKIYLKCPGSKYGCNWKGNRELLNKIHLIDCTFIKLTNYFENQELKLNNLTIENNFLRNQLSIVLDSIIQGKLTNLGYSLQLEEIMDQNNTVGPSSMSSTNGTSHNNKILNNLQDEDYIHLFIEFERLRTDMEKFRPILNEFEVNKQIMNSIINDNLSFKDDLNNQRIGLNSIRQQIQFMLVDRRRLRSSLNRVNAASVNGGSNGMAVVDDGKNLGIDEDLSSNNNLLNRFINKL